MSRYVAKVSRKCREMSQECHGDVARCRESVAKVSRDVTGRHRTSPSINFTSHFIKRDDMTTDPHEAGGSLRG